MIDGEGVMNEARLEKVNDLAAELHFGQKRKNGEDYISHPRAVVEIARRKLVVYEVVYNFKNPEIVLAICYLHDVIEDCGITEIELCNRLVELDYSREDAVKISHNVKLLSRMSKEEDIIGYLNGIFTSSYAIFVKKCDLEHNMSDLKPSNLLDKYKLIYYLLNNTISPM